MDITVVVANFNYGRYLGRCIRSLLSQSIDSRHYEIIVVDDGSNDDSSKIAENFGCLVLKNFNEYGIVSKSVFVRIFIRSSSVFIKKKEIKEVHI
jgi:glycosyltransferase involved in cell wall biosynthesis